MRTVAFLTCLIGGALAQSQNATYNNGLIAALASNNLTNLSSILTSINTTSKGQALLAALPHSPFTIWAPNNDAFAAVPSNVSSNATVLTDIISYHIVSGNIPTATSPNNTVGRTLLNDTSYVTLEGNKSQVLVWNKESNGTIEVLNQPSPVNVAAAATYSNLQIYVIPSVLAVPANLPDVLNANGLTSIVAVAETAPGLVETLVTLKGYTIFAPNNDAVTAAQSTISSLGGNTTLIATVLGNHIINGTSYYSTEINTSENLTSASGEPITFVSNSSGLYVLSGGVASAKILQTDLLTSNGVVHVIDTVLANTASDPAAASSAFASATSIAAQTSTSSSSSTSSSTSKSGQIASVRINGHVLIGLGVSMLCMILGGLSVL